jgi:hypothetical protein
MAAGFDNELHRSQRLPEPGAASVVSPAVRGKHLIQIAEEKLPFGPGHEQAHDQSNQPMVTTADSHRSSHVGAKWTLYGIVRDITKIRHEDCSEGWNRDAGGTEVRPFTFPMDTANIDVTYCQERLPVAIGVVQFRRVTGN